MKYYFTRSDYNKLHQNSRISQLITGDCESCHSHISKYLYSPHPDVNLFIIKLK